MATEREVSKVVEHLGEEVTVIYVSNGHRVEEKGHLSIVDPQQRIKIQHTPQPSLGVEIPFVGFGAAIQTIVSESGEVIFRNPLIRDDYDVWDMQKIEELRRETFPSAEE